MFPKLTLDIQCDSSSPKLCLKAREADVENIKQPPKLCSLSGEHLSHFPEIICALQWR